MTIFIALQLITIIAIEFTAGMEGTVPVETCKFLSYDFIHVFNDSAHDITADKISPNKETLSSLRKFIVTAKRRCSISLTNITHHEERLRQFTRITERTQLLVSADKNITSATDRLTELKLCVDELINGISANSLQLNMSGGFKAGVNGGALGNVVENSCCHVVYGFPSGKNKCCRPGFVEKDGYCACPKGSFLNKSRCDVCPEDTYQPKTMSIGCLSCPDGKITYGGTGADSLWSCLQACAPGQRYNSTSERCEACAKNTYQPLVGQRFCATCPNNTVTKSTGSTKQEDCVQSCPVGTSYNFVSKNCKLCPKNTFQPGEGQFKCISCESDRITTSNGSKIQTDCIKNCSAGTAYHFTSKTCVDCPLNTFQPFSGKTACVQCPVGTITLNTSTVRKEATVPVETCKFLSYDFIHVFNDSAHDITADKISPNKETLSSLRKFVTAKRRCSISLTNITHDEERFRQFTRITERTQLLVSVDKNITNATDRLTELKLCVNELIKGINANSLQLNVSGSLKAGINGGGPGNVVKKYCCHVVYGFPAGKNQCCRPGFVEKDGYCACPKGSFLNKSRCDVCPEDTYQPKTMSIGCLSCPDGKITYGKTGADNLSFCLQACSPGQRYNSTSERCEACAKNTYQPLVGQRFCANCPNNTVTKSTGSTKQEDCVQSCPVGTSYSFVSKNCKLCPKNTFQPGEGQFKCISCELDRITTSNGSKIQTDCIKRCHHRIENASSGSFGSYPAPVTEMDPRSQYCSWLITTHVTSVITLSFSEMTILSCDDTFLRIYDGANEKAPLMGTYCGSNASTQVEMTSSTNSLYVVANTGKTGRRDFSFGARYSESFKDSVNEDRSRSLSILIIILSIGGFVLVVIIVIIVVLVRKKRRNAEPKSVVAPVNIALERVENSEVDQEPVRSDDEAASEAQGQTSPENLTSTENYSAYVIPLQPEPSYAVPADENTGPYEDIYVISSETNLPVYTQLDACERDTENYYQKLVHFV
ncbi:signal peptide, CUB and EGF-like domain-containing protein 2 isoform X2 [Dendronephthya gigantea]|uniref:signal peptide, CUB and EGF-like domain-containing protein 2 isoform X2 n=1 Tax=Dendronephthya gigantea TaxID=151771 RepID=UPI00106BE40D|nr:signal peptide, CUB and EGF-like domain-containing protein 2 isoform X2 [Dendronephthya gigantea]